MPKAIPVNDRFDAKVDKYHGLPQVRPGLGPCWLWTDDTACVHGYGRIFISRKAGLRYAHVFAYERWCGPIPAGYEVDHRCCIRHCVNPDHLDAVPKSVNLARIKHEGAAGDRCRNGHFFTEVNERRDNRGTRYCALCVNERARRAYHRNRAQAGHSASP